MKKIIFRNLDSSIVVLTPTQEILECATIEQVAEKDTPYGLPYWIVDEELIPTDRTFRDAWTVNNDEPNGYGGQSDEFPEEVKL